MNADLQSCGRCGACCRHLIVEAEPLDVLREPLIAERVEASDADLPPENWTWLLTGKGRCVFLTAGNRCEIYPTRPNECVAFAPGTTQCTHARTQAGLPPLKPTRQPRWRKLAGKS